RRCTGLDDDAGDLIFVGHSSFCSMELGYMECDFRCNHQAVLVREDYPSIHPLLLESASRLYIPPICVSWVIIRKSARVVTSKGSGDNQHCGYWLRLEDSEAHSLDYGIVDLSVKDSVIGYINLPRLRQLKIHNSSVVSIDHTEILMYPSTISKSWIKDIFFMNITVADLKISDTVIDTIGPGSITFNGINLIFENVSIRNLKNRAINMLSGKLIMKNCSIDNVAENAIIADDSNIFLHDVTIGQIETPGFKFDSVAEAGFTNVTVGGQLIRSDSNYIRSPAIPEAVDVDEEVIITGFTNEYCEFRLGVLHCDFFEVNKPVIFERNSLPLQLTIDISNARILRAVGDFSCAHINIINCTGKFVSIVNTTCPSGGKLSVTRSNLTVISSKMASHIAINSSFVTTLHATSVKFLEVAHSTILSVYDVTVGREAAWSRSHFLQVSSLQLKGPGRIQDCKFDKVSSMELNPGKNTISLSSTMISSIPQKRSVWIRNGILSLENVTVFEAAPASLYLEEDATLTLNNVSFNMLIFGAISVRSCQQVFFDSEEGNDYAFLTQERSSTESVNSFLSPPGAYTADEAQSHCNLDAARLVCDYTHVQEAVVILSTNVSEVTLKRPSFVILRPTGTQFVAMSEVRRLFVDQHQIDAQLDLLVVNSTFINLTTVVHSFIFDNSSMNSFYLPLEHTMMSLTARNCEMRELVVQTQLAFFILSKIGNIHLLTGDSVLIRNSSVGKILPAGLVIRNDGLIESSQIDCLYKKSIVIHGKFIARNISISNAEENSIVIRDSGSVNIHNVTIQNSIKCPFLILGEIKHVSSLRINGVHISSSKSLLQYCGLDGMTYLSTKSSEWQKEVKNSRIFWLGLAVGAIISLLVAGSIVLVVRACRPGRRLRLPLVSWRNSSETVIYSGLKQSEPSHDEPADASPDQDSEKSRLVENEE
ncbi:hypothetical protein FHG87_015926, partial [Trinorchestia longiramus]